MKLSRCIHCNFGCKHILSRCTHPDQDVYMQVRGRCRKHFFQILSRHIFSFVFLNFKRGFLFLNFLIWGLLHLQKCTFMFTLRIYMATSGKYIEWPNKYINAQNRFQCYISSRNTPIAIIKWIRILKTVARSDRFWYSWRQSIVLLRTKICFRACRQ